MNKIECYEIKRTLWSMLASLSTIVISGIFIANIESFPISFLVCIFVYATGCSLINTVWNFYNKKIENYKKEHGADLSLESSQL